MTNDQTTYATQQPSSAPPPPPPRGEPRDSTPPPRPWRERIPEIVATIGASLVALAVVGFLSSTWEDITQVEKAMVLGATAAGLTAAGVIADRSTRDVLEYVVGITWSTASLLVAASVTLAASTTWPGYGRLTIAAGGVAALIHAVVLWNRRRDSILQQVTVFAAAVYAAGPFGTSVHDRFRIDDLETLFFPLAGFADPTFSSEAFLLTGIFHLLIAVAWAGLASQLSGRAAHVAKGVAIFTAAFAALELNVLAGSVGAVAALAVVIGFLIYGLVVEDTALVVASAIGGIAAGVRVLVAVFSGKELVTLLVLAGGIAMLAWAYVAMKQRRERDDDTG